MEPRPASKPANLELLILLASSNRQVLRLLACVSKPGLCGTEDQTEDLVRSSWVFHWHKPIPAQQVHFNLRYCDWLIWLTLDWIWDHLRDELLRAPVRGLLDQVTSSGQIHGKWVGLSGGSPGKGTSKGKESSAVLLMALYLAGEFISPAAATAAATSLYCPHQPLWNFNIGWRLVALQEYSMFSVPVSDCQGTKSPGLTEQSPGSQPLSSVGIAIV